MNTVGKLVDAWYNLLNGNVTVPVYRTNVPEAETGNYVIIRPESGIGKNNKRSFNDEVIIITDVVTKFKNNPNQRTAEAIDVAIFDLVLPTPRGGALNAGSGIQVLNVNRETFNYLEQSDGVNVYFRKISRYSHLVHQTT